MRNSTFSNMMKIFFDRVYKEDMVVQEAYLSEIAQDIRHVPVEFIYKHKGVFIPNSDYMIYFLGEHCRDLTFNLYNYDGMCRFSGRLIFPIYDFMNNIVGIVGYDNDTNVEGYVKYLYSNKQVFDKGAYLFITKDEYLKSLREGYLFIVDGIFDKINLVCRGYNATSTMGSILSDKQKAMIQFINRKIVVYDNDKAGLSLLEDCRKSLTNVTGLGQGLDWDIDDFFKSEGRVDIFDKTIQHILNNKMKFDHVIKRSSSFG